MKQIFTLLLSAASFLTVFAQPDGSSRSTLNPALFPFYHGIASGDPLSDRVILWTRITLDPAVDPVSVGWQVSTDTSFNTIVANGNTTTDSTKDYTIKVDATGLQQNTWYYYRFTYDTLKSITGRTRTLPTGAVNNLRFAVASCQDYQDGYYNAHRHLSQRNDIDAVLFLGDYTYEGGANVNVVGGRFHEPSSKTIQLNEYRMRQSLYHLDPDLQAAHQQYPWICVWDDHETANNSYAEGAKNHTINDGPWYDRKVNAIKTYYEWMPIRQPDIADTFKIFRRFTWGDLADLNMIDTRLYDRDRQVTTAQFVPTTDTTILDSTRNMLGPVQFDWLKNNLSNSTAKWQILGQQVILAPLIIPPGFTGPEPVMINSDQWDGYPFDRQKLYDHILNNNIQNVVVLTGDIHTAWANDLPLPGYDAQNRNNSVGVEFVTPSISSGNELPQLITAGTIYGLADYVRYVELSLHGYYVLDITPARTQGDFVYVSNVTSQNYTVSSTPSWYVNDGDRFLQAASGPSTALNTYPALAQRPSLNTAISKLTDNITTISIAPNPFFDEVVIQFDVQKAEELTLQVFNSSGKLMTKANLGLSNIGTNYAVFNGSNFPSGYYRVELTGKSRSIGKAVIKVN
ncbi:MAG: alkaline phosphatase D family protein [Bacteroidota bacterium]